MRRPRRRPSLGARLFLGTTIVFSISLALAGAGHYFGETGLERLYSGMWRLLGVRVESPAPVDVGPGDHGPDGPAGVPDKHGEGPVVSSDAIIIRTYRYELCGCSELGSHPVGLGMVGLDRQALTRELRDSVITAFSPEQVEVTTVFPGWCPEHVSRTVRLEGDTLLLFAGDLEQPDNLRLIRTIELRGGLNEYVRQILTEGLTYPNEEMAFRDLEGIGD